MIKTFKNSLKYILKNSKLSYIILILLTIITSLTTYFSILFMLELTNLANNIYNNNVLNFKPIIITLSFLIALFILFKVRNILSIKVHWKLKNTFNKFIMSELTSYNYENYESFEKVKKINIVGKEAINTILFFSKSVILNFFKQVTILISFFIVLKDLNFLIAIGFTIFLMIEIIISYKISIYNYKLIYKNEEDIRQKNYYYTIGMNKIAHQDINFYDLSYEFRTRFTKHHEKISKENYKISKKRFYTDLFTSICLTCFIFFITFSSVKSVYEGSIQITYLIAILVLNKEVMDFINQVVENYRNYGQNFNILKDLFNLLEDKSNKTNLELDTINKNFKSIELYNISYQYPNCHNFVLKDLNLTIKNNDKIGIIGINGSGKTTLISILIGLFQEYEGRILVDGEIKKYNNSNNCFAVIFQDFLKYQFSIRENLLIGNPNKALIQDNEIFKVLKQLEIDNFIESLPKGLETDLGLLKEGIDFSMGMWQKLALARLLLNKTASIWIFDEPTAHLEPIIEVEIYHLIYKLGMDKTIIFVSHRMGFSRFMNRLVILDQGKKIEEGSFEELISKDTIFKKMFEVQKKWYE